MVFLSQGNIIFSQDARPGFKGLYVSSTLTLNAYIPHSQGLIFSEFQKSPVIFTLYFIILFISRCFLQKVHYGNVLFKAVRKAGIIVKLTIVPLCETLCLLCRTLCNNPKVTLQFTQKLFRPPYLTFFVKPVMLSSL